MDKKFWIDRWRTNKIGFHLTQVNPILIKNISYLSKDRGSSVLVPMCGKSLDLLYLQSIGLNVIGFEIDQSAVEAFFYENDLKYSTSTEGEYLCYRSRGIMIYVGDYLSFPFQFLKKSNVRSIYDRAALVALPKEMRQLYYKKMIELYPSGSSVLYITFEYDDTYTSGPPFSISMQELEQSLSCDFEINFIEEYIGDDQNPRIRKIGCSNVIERVLLLKRK